MKIVSACLLGIKCNYRGEANTNQELIKEYSEGESFPVCPEVFGGLGIPRIPSEIYGGSGKDVLCGNAKVIDFSGKDVTEKFIKGAEITLHIAKTLDAKEAVLKSNSPSCGFGKIYDGTFSKKLKDGDGVTAALLKANGIRIITERYL